MIYVFGLLLVAVVAITFLFSKKPGTAGIPVGQRLPLFAAPLADSTLNGAANLHPHCTLAQHEPAGFADFPDGVDQLCPGNRDHVARENHHVLTRIGRVHQTLQAHFRHAELAGGIDFGGRDRNRSPLALARDFDAISRVRFGPAGRRASLAGGPDAWEVVRVYQGVDGSGEEAIGRTAELTSLVSQQVRVALGRAE